jgi:predicted permease
MKIHEPQETCRVPFFISQRCYRLIIRLYPASFREAHGAEMESVCVASLRIYRKRWGLIGIPLGWVFILRDTVWHGVRLRLRGRGASRGFRRRSSGPVGRFRRALWEDGRFAARHLTRNRGFTLTIVATLALGIGLITAVFGAVYSLLLRPLPGVENPEELVQVYRTRGLDAGFLPASIPLFEDLRDSNEAFSGVAAWTFAPLSTTVGDRAERVLGQIVSSDFFEVLGVPLARGRGLSDEPGEGGHGQRVVVVSEGFWQNQLGGAPGVVGSTLGINGARWEIIGVAGRDFRGPMPLLAPALWAPLAMHPELMRSGDQSENRGNNFLELVARLKRGTEVGQAQEWASGFAARLQERYPDFHDQVGLRLFPQEKAGIHPAVRNAQVGLSGVVLGMVVLLLVIACVNVASLLLAKSQGRAREFGVRRSLGAPRRRVVSQLLLESLLLSLLAGGVGVVLALVVVDLMNRIQVPVEWTVDWNIALGGPVLAFTGGVTLLTSLIFGLTPALRSSNPDLVSTLKGSSPRMVGKPVRSGRALVGVQVAVSTVLLVCAGLFARNLRDALAVDVGFRHERLALATLDPGLNGYGSDASVEVLSELLARAKALPGVQSAGLARNLPLEPGGPQQLVEVPGYEPARGESMNIQHNIVDPEYFAAMGIPVVEGRGFLASDGVVGLRDRARGSPDGVGEALAGAGESSDGAGGLANTGRGSSNPGRNSTDPGRNSTTPGRNSSRRPVQPSIQAGAEQWTAAVVNRRFAERFWPGENPLGKTFLAGSMRHEVVGVVPTGKYQRLGEEPTAFMYFPWPTHRAGEMTLHVRTATDAASVLPLLRREVGAVAPGLPLYDLKTMDEHLALALLPARVAAFLLGGFGAVCLCLLSLGIYGVVARHVSQRTRELGIRVAMGAEPGSATRLVMGEEARVVGVGVLLGLAGALGVSRLVESALYSGDALDPAVLVGAPLFLALVAAAASYFPARRAAGVDPAQALREE